MMIAFLFFSFFSHASADSLNGTYERSCYLVEDDALVSGLSIQADRWVVSHDAFEDEACAKKYLRYEVQYKASTQESNVDLSAQEVSYVSYSDVVTRALNEMGYCGADDWQTNVKKIVTGQVCDSFQAPRLGEITYSIFKLDAAVTPKLFFMGVAGEADGKTPATRFQNLESKPYVQK